MFFYLLNIVMKKIYCYNLIIGSDSFMKQMKFKETNLADCFILEPDRYGDNRW